MDFTDDMIRDVLQALKHPELRAQHSDEGHFEASEQVVDKSAERVPRPSGRHFREESALLAGSRAGGSVVEPFARRGSEHRQPKTDDRLYTPARDYIVTVINRIIRRLEKAG